MTPSVRARAHRGAHDLPQAHRRDGVRQVENLSLAADPGQHRPVLLEHGLGHRAAYDGGLPQVHALAVPPDAHIEPPVVPEQQDPALGPGRLDRVVHQSPQELVEVGTAQHLADRGQERPKAVLVVVGVPGQAFREEPQLLGAEPGVLGQGGRFGTVPVLVHQPPIMRIAAVSATGS